MDINEAKKIRKLALEKDGFIKKEWLRDKGLYFIAVAETLYEDEMDGIIKYAKKHDIYKLNCIAAEDLQEELFCEIDINIKSLFERNTVFPLIKHMIFPDNLDFLILTDNDFYHLFVGTKEFLELVLIDGLEETKKYFKNDISKNTGLTKQGRERLLDLPKKYAEFYPK